MKIFIFFIYFICISFFSAAQQNLDDELAYHYYQQGDYEKASILLEKLFNQNKNDRYFELYFNSLLKVKKYKESESILKGLIKQQPEKFQYKVALGRVYQESGRSVEANKTYLETIDNTSKDENIYRQLANEFYRFEAYDMAANVYLHARKSLADNQVFTFELLSIYRYKKNKSMLVQEYINVLASVPQMLTQAQNVLSSIFEDNADYQFLQLALLKKIQKEPQIEVYTDLLIWQFIQQQAYESALRQLIAQDKRINGNGDAIYSTANIFITNKAFTAAIKAYEYILTKGTLNELNIPAKIGLINAKYELAIAGKYDQQAIKDLTVQYQDILTTYGKSPQTLFAVKKLAYLQAYHLNELNKAEITLEEGIAIKGLSEVIIAELKIDLGDIYLLAKQPWEAILVYEQVAKQFEGQVIGSEARYRSAKLNFYIGDFGYAKSQADVLKASTSTLISNDALNLSLLISDNLLSKNDSLALKIYADADRLQFMNKPNEALKKLDSIDLLYPVNSLTDDILMAKAKIYINNNEILSSTASLKELIEKHQNSLWIDDALFMLADILEKKLNNLDEAKKFYNQLINQFPGSMYNAEARKRFRNIRGDNIGT